MFVQFMLKYAVRADGAQITNRGNTIALVKHVFDDEILLILHTTLGFTVVFVPLHHIFLESKTTSKKQKLSSSLSDLSVFVLPLTE